MDRQAVAERTAHDVTEALPPREAIPSADYAGAPGATPIGDGGNVIDDGPCTGGRGASSPGVGGPATEDRQSGRGTPHRGAGRCASFGSAAPFGGEDGAEESYAYEHYHYDEYESEARVGRGQRVDACGRRCGATCASEGGMNIAGADVTWHSSTHEVTS